MEDHCSGKFLTLLTLCCRHVTVLWYLPTSFSLLQVEQVRSSLYHPVNSWKLEGLAVGAS